MSLRRAAPLLALLTALAASGCATGDLAALVGGEASASNRPATAAPGTLLYYVVEDAGGLPVRRGAFQVLETQPTRDGLAPTVGLQQVSGAAQGDRLLLAFGLVPVGMQPAAGPSPDAGPLTQVAETDLDPLWPLATGKSVSLPLPAAGEAPAGSLTLTVSDQSLVVLEGAVLPVFIIDIDQVRDGQPVQRISQWFSEDLGLALRTVVGPVEGTEVQPEQVLTIQRIVLPPGVSAP